MRTNYTDQGVRWKRTRSALSCGEWRIVLYNRSSLEQEATQFRRKAKNETVCRR